MILINVVVNDDSIYDLGDAYLNRQQNHKSPCPPWKVCWNIDMNRVIQY